MSCKAVLFDLDETLFDRTRSVRAFLADQIRRHESLQFAQAQSVIDRFMELDQRGRVPKDRVYAALVPGDRDICEVLLAEYETDLWQYAHFCAGAEQTLADLRRLEAKIGIVTNGKTLIQGATIRGLSLEDRVDTILISEAEGLRKPDPTLFQRAADRLSVRPSECIFVGDSPEADIGGAKRAGMKAVWFRNGTDWPLGTDEVADATVTSLEDVLGLYQRWC